MRHMSKKKKSLATKADKTDMQVMQSVEKTLKALPNNTGETQFEVAMYYWDHRNPRQAERWLRYASHEGHELARSFLSLGVQLGFFFSISNQLNKFAIEVLEYFITPQPEENQIRNMESVLLKHLTKEYGLKI